VQSIVLKKLVFETTEYDIVSSWTLNYMFVHGARRRRGMARGVPVVSSPSGVRGRAPAGKAFRRILKGHRTLFLVPVC